MNHSNQALQRVATRCRTTNVCPLCAVKGLKLGGNMETMDYWWTELRRSHPKARAIWWHIVLVLCGQMLFVEGSWAQERRTALVIGNSTYQKSPLVNPVNDAQAMATTLGSLGF